MPVYEYRCDECCERFELFLRSAARRTTPTCPRCGSPNARKAISIFGVGNAGGGSGVRDTSCGPGPV